MPYTAYSVLDHSSAAMTGLVLTPTSKSKAPVIYPFRLSDNGKKYIVR